MTPEAAILACPLLRHEVEAVARPLGLPVVPAACRCDALDEPVQALQSGPGDRPLAALCEAGAGQRGLGPAGGPAATCFHLVAGAGLVDGLTAAGAHLVTPGWLHGWPQRLEAEGLGGEAGRALLREGARRVVLLDTGLDPGAGTRLAAFAAHAGLPAEVLPVGLDHLALRLGRASAEAARERAERRAADAEAVLDVLAGVGAALEEQEVADRFLDLAVALFGAGQAAWLSFDGDRRRVLAARGDPDGRLEAALAAQGEDLETAPGGAGLLLRIGPAGGEVARLGFDAVAFEGHLDRYREVAPMVASAAWLAAVGARSLEALGRSEAQLRLHRDHLDQLVSERTAELERTAHERELALESARVLRGLLPICFGCKKIRDDEGYWTRLEVFIQQHSEATFSHGLCPECLDHLYPEEKA